MCMCKFSWSTACFSWCCSAILYKLRSISFGVRIKCLNVYREGFLTVLNQWCFSLLYSYVIFSAEIQKYIFVVKRSGSQSMGRDQTWVTKGRKMGRAKIIQIYQKELFSFATWRQTLRNNMSSKKNRTFFFSFFKFCQFRHRLNYCIIRISFGFILLKLDYCIISGFPRVLMAAQLLAVISC